MQFGMRTVFFAVAAVGLYFGISRTAGYGVTTGVFLAAAAVAWAILWRRRSWRYVRLSTVVVALPVLWFLAVEWSWFENYCDDCLYGRDIGQYRVLGIPVYTETIETPTRIQWVLRDIGAPCPHANRYEGRRVRLWGLVVCACPCIRGISGLADNLDAYSDDTASTLRRIGEENPQLAAELHDLAVKDHNYQLFWKTVNRLTAEAAVANQDGSSVDTEHRP